jgi:hypothetical protein
VTKREPAPPPPPPPPLVESPLPPSGAATFEIAPIAQAHTDDPQEIVVESAVKNVGTRESRSVKVWVSALDAGGARIAQVEIEPTPQAIPPGGMARFTVRFPNNPAIRTFHVEAFGQ